MIFSDQDFKRAAIACNMDLEIASEFLEAIYKEAKYGIPEIIQQELEYYFEISLEDCKGRHLGKPAFRKAFSYFMRKYSNLSLPQIQKLLGYTSHSSVITNIYDLEEVLANPKIDPKLYEQIQELDEIIPNSIIDYKNQNEEFKKKFKEMI